MTLSNLKLASLSDIACICGLSESIESNDCTQGIEGIGQGVSNLDRYLCYRYFDSGTHLFFGDGGVVGFSLEISSIVGVDDGLLKNLAYFFNDEMQDNSYMQFLLVASSDVEDVLSNWKREKTNNHEHLQKIIKKREEFVRNQASCFGNSDGRIARDYRIFVNFSQIVDAKDKGGYSGITAFKTQVLNKFESLGLSPMECDASTLIALCRTILQMSLSGSSRVDYNDKILLSKQILSPAQIHQISGCEIKHLSTGLVSKCYHIKELPQEFSLAQNVNLLGDNIRDTLGIPARFIISYTVASNVSATSQTSITSRGKKVIEASEKWYSRNDRDLKREASEWQDIVDRSGGGERFLSEHWQLMVTSTEDSIDIVQQNLISLYNINNFRLQLSKNLQLPAALSMLPMQQGLMWKILDKFKLTRLVLSSEVIPRLPIHAEWKGVPRSGVLLHARRGQLFNFNPFYKISSGNYNICIFAPSGGGKSVFLQELAITQMAQNTRVFILDIGQSFANICRLLDGEIIQFGKQSPFSLNPFASFCVGMSDEDKDEFLKCTKSLLEVMCNVGDDARGAADLEKAIKDALIQNNYVLDITSFAKCLEASKSKLLQQYGATLYPYTKVGLYGKYFSGSTTASFKRLITVFEFEEIKNDPKLLSIVLQILLMEVTNQFLTGDRLTPFMIIVDEAWMLLDFAASFFAAFVRTVRKYGGSLVICVQNFTDLHKTVDHKTILENSTWTILLKQDEKGLGSFKDSESFKDMIPLIRSISLSPNKYAEMLIYTTGVSVIGRLVLDDYSKALYSTDAQDFAFLHAQQIEGVSLETAIEGLVEHKSRNASRR